MADLDLLPQALERLRVLNANLNPTQAGQFFDVMTLHLRHLRPRKVMQTDCEECKPMVLFKVMLTACRQAEFMHPSLGKNSFLGLLPQRPDCIQSLKIIRQLNVFLDLFLEALSQLVEELIAAGLPATGMIQGTQLRRATTRVLTQQVPGSAPSRGRDASAHPCAPHNHLSTRIQAI